MFMAKFNSSRVLCNILIGLMLAAFGLSACAPGAQQPPEEGEATAVAHGNEIGGYVELIDSLRAAGATVEPAGEVDQPFFEVTGQLIRVNEADVQVFEFADEATRQAVSETIPPDPTSIGTTMITWVDQPNFWAKGRVIVLYIGQDADIINLLTSVLGDPIAQGS